MKKSKNLHLYEEIMLLSLRDEKGTIQIGYAAQTIAGAILAQLVLEGRISIENSKKKLVDVLSTGPSGDPILDEAIEKLSTAKRRASLSTWVQRIAGIKDLLGKAARQLCDRGILKLTEDKILFVFTRKVYPEINPLPEKKIIERMRNAVFSDSQKLKDRDIVLISLTEGSGLLQMTFSKKELKPRKKRIEQIVNGELVGKATKEVIDACQAAIMIGTVIIPMITTTIITT